MLKKLAELKAKHRWILAEERLPNGRDYILLSFENFSIPLVGRYEEDAEAVPSMWATMKIAVPARAYMSMPGGHCGAVRAEGE